MQMNRPAHLVLEDGTAFSGRAAGAPGVSAGEICFTTAMAGYEEAVTDPSYSAQVLTFSYPLVGNYGVDESRMESDRVWTEGVVSPAAAPRVRGLARRRGASSRSRRSTPGRSFAMSAPRAPCAARSARRSRASCSRGRSPSRTSTTSGRSPSRSSLTRRSACSPARASRTRSASGPRVAVLDFGCKRSIVGRLAERGLEAYVCPPTYDADAVLELKPRVVLVGNGPGDPAQLTDAIQTVRDLLGRVELFGVCLGHQLLGLALGLGTYKLPFGHRGANHPVRVRDTSRVLVTVQNHGFAVDASDAPEVSHLSLNDGTVEGLAGDGFASLQFHPEAAPGPLDAIPFFDRIADACRSAPTFAAS